MKKLIIGISGASGVIYGIRLLEILQGVADVETHLVMSNAGAITVGLETNYAPAEVLALADVSYKFGDIAAAISSGSFKTHGMIVAPCSILEVIKYRPGRGSLSSPVSSPLSSGRKPLAVHLRRYQPGPSGPPCAKHPSEWHIPAHPSAIP